jgi:hypothetical protein
VTDLYHTDVLGRASDVLDWASTGPGARRGLNRIHGRRRPGSKRKGWGLGIAEEQAIEEMRELLEMSRERRYWPQWDDTLGRYDGANMHDMELLQNVPPQPAAWPDWTLREVEHTLCEFDKYERVRTGEGKPRGSFDGG